jgi:hypothetical protein
MVLVQNGIGTTLPLDYNQPEIILNALNQQLAQH